MRRNLHPKRFTQYILCTAGLYFIVSSFIQITPSFLHPPGEESYSQLYFESKHTFKLRLQLEQSILYGARLKKIANSVFNSREGYNESHLDSLPLIRRNDIPELRFPACSSISYKPRSETKVSVVICYYNELLSLIIRTVYSIIDSIPPENFHELILIDDGSDMEVYPELSLVEPLVYSFSVSVKFHHFEENKGLIFARRFGCELASGDAVLVIDSHIEVKAGFLEPLLAVIDRDYNSIASPIIYNAENLHKFHVWPLFHPCYLGFNRYLDWFHVCNSTRKESTEPYQASATTGGAFIATKRFLQEVDYFGRGMEGWGDENIEISLKTWMCGKELLYVPCSQVLHHNANRNPANHGTRKKSVHVHHNAALQVKSFFPQEYFNDFNTWAHLDRNRSEYNFDSYAETISLNREVIAKNNCSRNFEWIRRTLMPRVDSFDGETLVGHTLKVGDECAYFMIRSWQDTRAFIGPCNEAVPLADRPRLTIWGELRSMIKAGCLDWGFVPRIQFRRCHSRGGNQKTIFENGQVKSAGNGYCLVRIVESRDIEIGYCNNTGDSSYEVIQFHFGVVFDTKKES